MLSRISKRTRVSENAGFTLIELLVVVIIIGILAAIAIPMYLSQRTKGWEANAKSDLRNAAVAQESYYTQGLGYADGVAAVDAGGELNLEGFNKSSNITFDAVVGGVDAYCMEAHHNSGGDHFILDSTTGESYAGTGDC